MGNDGVPWRGVIGRNSRPDLNLSGVQLLDFCTSRSSSTTNTMFRQKVVYRCNWHQDSRCRSMINFVVMWPHVLDTRVKKGSELSTHHHLVVSWIGWWWMKLCRPGRPKPVVRVCLPTLFIVYTVYSVDKLNFLSTTGLEK